MKVGMADNGWLWAIGTTSSDIINLNIWVYATKTEYDNEEAAITSISVSSKTAGNPKTFRVPCTPVILNSLSINVIPDGTYAYKVVLRTASANLASMTFFLEDCTKYNKVRLHFLNRWGGFDAVNFNLVSKKNISIERHNYLKPVPLGYDKTFRGNINYANLITERQTLNSTYLSDAESIWLQELISSPQVFMENGNSFIAVNVVQDSYEIKKSVNDKNFNLSLEIEVANKNYSQSL